MGAIRRLDTSGLEQLCRRHTVGRNANCRLVINRPAISSLHAAFDWRDGCWYLRDLNSSNGTFVNGQRLLEGVPGRALALGDVVGFAENDERWELCDVTPPASALLSLDDNAAPIILAREDVRILSSEGQPHVEMFHARGCWQLERSGLLVPLADGEVFEVEGRSYRLHVDNLVEPTAEPMAEVQERTLEYLYFTLEVSPDEESAGATVQLGADLHELPSRTFMYLLVFLARRRIADVDTHGPDAGWVEVETVLEELQFATPDALALHVHRCRKAIASCGVEDPAMLIDRSRRGLLRIGVAPSRLSIITS